MGRRNRPIREPRPKNVPVKEPPPRQPQKGPVGDPPTKRQPEHTYGCVGGASQCPNQSVNSTSARETKKTALKTGFRREPESPKANNAVIPNTRIHKASSR